MAKEPYYENVKMGNTTFLLERATGDPEVSRGAIGFWDGILARSTFNG